MRQKHQQLKGAIVEAAEACFSTGRVDEDEMAAFHRSVDRLLAEAGVGEISPEVKRVTILLSDLRGFTAMSESCPATDVIGMLNGYFSRMSEIIAGYGGIIDKFMGDAILALFGVPEAAEDDLERALACAVDMQRAMDEINHDHEQSGLPSIHMGIGINTGDVAAGSLGSDVHREYTVIGDEVNLASRIEAYSLRGQILLSENSHQLAGDLVETGSANEVYVKGRREPVRLYDLIAVLKPERVDVPRRDPRNSPRVMVTLPLVYQCVEEKQVLPEKYEGEVLDISYSGMLARMHDYLPPYTEIKITLSLSIMGGATAAVYAKVLRSAKADGGFESSVEFTGLGADAQKAIKHFIDRIIGSG
ncbi:MAG: adenylate/guanylate cyclase domain-containing protein [Candidatus Sedimenticola sp. PURPLELP]